jgi:pilus assembly protein CpaF
VIAGFEVFLSFIPELGPLLDDPDVSEVQVCSADKVFVERSGQLERADLTFDPRKYRVACELMAQQRCGVELTEHNAIVDSTLPDGSRVSIVAPPVSVDGISLTVRKHQRQYRSLEDLVGTGMMPDHVAGMLKDAAVERKNVLVSGETGCGKTTILDSMLSCVPVEERVFTIEDTTELNPPHSNRVRLCAQPAANGKPAVTIQKLVQASLRQTPSRIIVGEFRGAEAFDVLVAMNTGFSGMLLSCHANGPEDALERLFLCATMGSPRSVSDRFLQGAICRNVHLIVHLEKRREGGSVRRVVVAVGISPRYERQLEAFDVERIYDVASPPASAEGADKRGLNDDVASTVASTS